MLPDGILPDTAAVTEAGHLTIGGCDVVELAKAYGTPLYVYDEATIRARAKAFRDALADYPATATVCYAAKAYCAPWLLRLLADEGLGLDVVSGGELHAAATVGFPRERIYVHGNNKSDDELDLAVRERVGRVVIDNLEEIERLGARARSLGARQPVLLRVSPGVAAQTHEHLRTGAADTKFGLGIASGAAAIGIEATMAHSSLELRGLHAHIGSQITELDPYREAVERVFLFAREMRERTGFSLREISPGGGYGVRYTPSDPPADAPAMAKGVARAVLEAAQRHGLPPPGLAIEPGRSLVASAGVAVYRVGSVKEIPGVRTYVAVDGGMADNIRPTAYGAAYTAVVANRMRDAADAMVAIAGRYCESGDVLIRAVSLPLPRPDDVIAIPASGAYQLSMASNYNMAPRPAVVVVNGGRARLVQRRESYADLLARDEIEQR